MKESQTPFPVVINSFTAHKTTKTIKTVSNQTRYNLDSHIRWVKNTKRYIRAQITHGFTVTCFNCA